MADWASREGKVGTDRQGRQWAVIKGQPVPLQSLPPAMRQQLLTGTRAPTTPGGFPVSVQDRAAAEKTIGQARTAAQTASQVIPQLDAFDAANRRQGSGPVYGEVFGVPVGEALRGVADTLSPGGFFNPAWDGRRAMADRETMKSVSSYLTPRQRPEGSGATSDFEQRLYARGAPTIDKLGATNERISDYMRDQSLRAIRYRDFLQRYYGQNGHINGADEAFDRQEAAAGRLSGSYADVYGAPAPSAPGQSPAMRTRDGRSVDDLIQMYGAK